MPEADITLASIHETLAIPFWSTAEFWINIVIAIAGVMFSLLAFIEAKQARRAATEAGRTVKIQTVTIELTEIGQKLDRIKPEIPFSDARDLLAEINRRIRRVTSPFAGDTELGPPITSLREALHVAENSLKDVRPTDATAEAAAPNAVYNAIEGDFATINNCVADLLGLFEKKTIDFGDADAES